LELEYETAVPRATVSPIQSHQVELDGLQILEQQIESRKPLQGCD